MTKLDPLLLVNHSDFAIINKPANISMHKGTSSHHNEDIPSIIPWAKDRLGVNDLYLVHRLDTGTSGCLLLAKNKSTAAYLSALFAKREINKVYIALSHKKSQKKQGKISADLAKSRNGSYKVIKSKDNPAITFFFRQLIYANSNNDDFSTLYAYFLKPITGKTHQLRVVLKSLQSPILGDSRYSGAKADRLYLHSHYLSFTYHGEVISASCHPQTGDYFSRDVLNDLWDIHELRWPKYIHPPSETRTE